MGEDLTNDLFKAYEELERQKHQQKTELPIQIDPKAKRLIAYVSKHINQVTRQFVGTQNTDTVRNQMADAIHQAIVTALSPVGFRPKMPTVDVQQHPTDPNSMVISFSDPDTGAKLEGPDLFKYLGII